MKVLHLFNEINFSGAELMYASAAPIFQKNGFELIAFSTGNTIGDFSHVFEKNKILVYHKQINFCPFSFKGYKYYSEFYRFLINEKIEILQIHRNDLIFASIIAWAAKVKCIKTQHSTFRNRWFTLPYAILWRSVLRIFFNVTFQTIGESVYLNELNYYKNPSLWINNWYNEKRFYPANKIEEKSRLRDQYDLPKDAFVVISTGNCSDVKNHRDIIHALALIKDRINCVFLHLGQGLLEHEEKELAEKLGVTQLIRFLGNLENVRDYLVAADLFLMTSKYEGLSIATLEAMACNLPSVLYDVPGLRDLITENDNGFLIEPNYRTLADKIIYFQQNPVIAEIKASNAFSFANLGYSMFLNVPKIIELYRK